MYVVIRPKYPLFLSSFKDTFLVRFSKSTVVSNSMKNLPMAAELFLADGRTDGPVDKQV